MAQLVKCSLCGRSVSSEAKSCPGCGHNVASELYQKEREKKDKWEEQGLCRECGKNNFEQYEAPDYHYVPGLGNQHLCDRIYKKCRACGWRKEIASKNWSI